MSVTEWVALRWLWGRAGCSHGELVQAQCMTKGAAPKVVSRLEGRGKCMWSDSPTDSLHRDALGQIPWFVHIGPTSAGRVVRQQLQRYHMQDG